MTRPIAAIVESAASHHAAAVDLALQRVRDAVEHAEQADRRQQQAHEAVRMRRLELGRALAAARKDFPVSGKNAKAWTDFLSVRRLTLEQAQDAIAYAGHVALTGGSGNPPAKLPTRAEAGLDSPRVQQPERDAEPERENEPPAAPRPVLTEDVLALLDQLDQASRGQIMRSLRSRQGRENEGDRDAYCTPPEITAALPEVDLDPCSNARSTVRARKAYILEAGQDGLVLPWSGLMYCNPPYSAPLPWAQKLAAEWVNLTGAGFLVNADHSPKWWHVLKQALPIRLDFDERLEFVPPPGVEPSKNDRPQTLLMDAAFWAACDQAALLKLGTLWRQDRTPMPAAQSNPAALHIVP